jgi:hypothetical protein
MRLVSWVSTTCFVRVRFEARDGGRGGPGVVEADEALGLEVLSPGMLIIDGGADVKESGG